MKDGKVIDFMKFRKVAFVFSLIVVFGSIFEIARDGLNFGLDFTGGTLIELQYDRPADLQQVRQDLENGGFEHFSVVGYGSDSDVMIRVQKTSDPKLSNKVIDTLKSEGAEITLKRVEYVGPQVGGELREQGILAIVAALAVMMVYVSIRFQWKFALGAVFALVHDIVFTLGCFAFFNWSFDLTVLAALLAVIGYSLNDTIVVSDHVRESFRELRSDDTRYLINAAITKTAERTIITSLTTLLVVIALFVFGGETIHGFATAMMIGIIVGTYSSIFVSSSFLMTMKLTRQDLLAKEKEAVDPNGVV